MPRNTRNRSSHVPSMSLEENVPDKHIRRLRGISGIGTPLSILFFWIRLSGPPVMQLAAIEKRFYPRRVSQVARI